MRASRSGFLKIWIGIERGRVAPLIKAGNDAIDTAIYIGYRYTLLMYVRGEILDWSHYNENRSGLSEKDEQPLIWRAHDIWRHASSLVSPDCSEFSLADAITVLKRAVDHRLKALRRRYCFD